MYDVYSDTNYQAKYFQKDIINTTSYVHIILPRDLVRFIAFNFHALAFYHSHILILCMIL